MAVQLDLHIAIREAYVNAMARGTTEREAFELATALVLDRDPQPVRDARRLVSVMLSE
jgi:hypothetical protein